MHAKKKSSLSWLMEFSGRHRYLTYASWVLSAASALLALVPFWYIWQIIREVLEVAPHFETAKHLISNGWMAVIFAVTSLLVYFSALLCSHLAAFRVAANIRITLMRHIVKLPLGYLENFGSGRLRKIINESSAATETYLAHQLPDKAGAIATPIGLLCLLMLFDWRLGLLSLVPVILGFTALGQISSSLAQGKMREYENALADMSNEAVEYVRGIPVVKTFGQTVHSFKKFRNSIERYGMFVIAYTKECRKAWLLFTMGVNSIFAFLIAAGIWFTRDGVPDGFLLNLLFYIIVTPALAVTMQKIMYMGQESMIIDDAISRIETLLHAKLPEVNQPVAEPADASVELRHVSYSYNGVKPALDDVSLRIEHGQKVAFVGPSGGGKTTLANLIARFFDPVAGQVLIGGVDVRNMNKKTLMNTVAFVFQNSRLIKASILDNVRMAKPDASREEVLRALESAQCQDIINKFPLGVDTVIGSKGVHLSGGEQQRIAIARVMLKNASILLLDEATAFADPDNEAKVHEAFSVLARNKTVIMIAHRLSTVLNADRIFVLKDGKIVESGSFADLKKRNGILNRMWEDYQTSVQWKVAREN